MSNKTNLTLDLIIFAAFLLVASPRSTGNTIHEWLSIAFLGTIVLHLLFHWKWIVTVTKDLFKKLFHQSRLDYVVDSVFLIAMTGAMFTGIMISRDVLGLFGLTAPQGGAWKSIHSLTSDLSIISLGVHIALHWKWILNTLDRTIVQPVKAMFQKSPELAPVPVRMDEQK